MSLDFLIDDAWCNRQVIIRCNRQRGPTAGAGTTVHVIIADSAFTKRVDKSSIFGRVADQTQGSPPAYWYIDHSLQVSAGIAVAKGIEICLD